MKLCTVGLGYIGLPTSIMFAKYGTEVVGVDINEEAVGKLNSGEVHIEEPGLQEALEKVLEDKLFRASLIPEKADVFIISVPTPNTDDENKSCDLSIVQAAVSSILPYVEKGNIVIVESTIAPRSTDDTVKPMLEKAGFTIGKDIYLVHCPERVLPGQIMHELVYNNRIVGGITEKCAEEGARVYGTFVQGEIIKTDAKTAEMSKLMENTYRDVNIALANELAKICNELEINTLDVIEMANKHPRVNIHSPGPGVGGHCLAVDPYFIIEKSPDTAKLMKLSREINNDMPNYVVENVRKVMETIQGKVVTVFGLTYKGNVDDIRQSPAIEIFNKLKDEGEFEIRAYDPHVDLDWVESDIKKAVKNSDLILILSDHNEFKTFVDNELMGMNNRIIIDTKNIAKDISTDIKYYNFGNLFESTISALFV